MILDIKKELIEDFISEISGNPKDVKLLKKWKVKPDVAQMILDIESGFPEFEIVDDQVIVQEDHVIVLGRFRGAQTEEFLGYPPTNKLINIPLILYGDIEEKGVGDMDLLMDRLTMLEKLGLTANPANQTRHRQNPSST